MGSGVRPSVCRVPRPNLRTERPRKPKIGRMKHITLLSRIKVTVSPTSAVTSKVKGHDVNAHQFQGHQLIKLIKAETISVSPTNIKLGSG